MDSNSSSSLAPNVDSELFQLLCANNGLLKLLSDNFDLETFCSHSGKEPDGIGASSTNSAVVATEGNFKVASTEVKRFKNLKICSNSGKEPEGLRALSTKSIERFCCYHT